MTRGRVSRADLLRAILECPDDLKRAGALIGYELIPDSETPRTQAEQASEPESLDAAREPESAPVESPLPTPEIKLQTWRVVGYERLETRPEDRPRILSRPTLPNKSPAPPRITPLSPTRSLLVRLQTLWQQEQFRGVDLDALVKRMSRGEVLLDLPRKRERFGGSPLEIIVDRSQRLVPYWDDQDAVLRSLLPHFRREAIGLYLVSERERDALSILGQGFHGENAQILVLGDLGALERGRQGGVRDWWELGQRVRQAGGRPQALVPCPVSYLPDSLREVWEIIPWEPYSVAVAAATEPTINALHLLQVLLSPAIRLEPGLVRQVRRMLPDGNRDPALEALFWQAPELSGTSSIAATWQPEAANKLRREFHQPFHPDAAQLRHQALQIHESWRRHLPDEIFFEELLELGAEVANLGWESEYQLALNYFHWLAQNPSLLQPGNPHHDWCRRWERRLSDATGSDSPAAWDLAQIHGYVHQHDREPPSPPSWLSTVQFQATQQQPKQTIAVCEAGDGLTVQRLTEGPRPPRVVAELTSRNGLLQTEVPFWKGPTPSFAKRYGLDQYGPWFEFEVERKDAQPVSQRMRWIPAGSFLMGSPDSDKDAQNDEKPQHPVAISRGFWIFDTPCTSALWNAVMGIHHLSAMHGRDPITSITWYDTQQFMSSLHTLLRLKLRAPSEAEWEYACRAGTTTRYCWGDGISARDARFLEDNTYRSNIAPVRSYPLNSWGLYDMHGNVWEWCLDDKRHYTDGPVEDPVGKTANPSRRETRMIRGGSAYELALNVRAAARRTRAPSASSHEIGFRCVWVQSESELVEPLSNGFRDKNAELAPTSRGRAIHVEDHPHPINSTLPNIIVRTDREQVTLQAIVQPSWAIAFGHDRYGLWADFLVQAAGKPRGWLKRFLVSSPSAGRVIQRLRWIPPGTFQMGSPESEEGRSDHEGPQHLVILTDGFWMFDTPCTQALWQAVMGDNPSRFIDPQRPVERIDWNQARVFAQRLSAQHSEMRWDLPTEAQWEYACRGGTETATYTGPVSLLGESNAPVLHDIAWYRGNSGCDFDLQSGENSSTWKEKQFEHQQAGTRKVSQKHPNPWGLYDMLGNVWEWCRDGMRNYTVQSTTDPDEPTDAATKRVIRGCSWFSHARLVRAAYRLAGVPSLRHDDLGFRCIWAPSRSSVSAEAVPPRGETKPQRVE